MLANLGRRNRASCVAANTAIAVCPEKKKSFATLYVTSNDGTPGSRQIIPSGVGSTHSACVNCLKANSNNSPTNGRIVGPKIEVTINQMPSTPTTAELETSNQFACSGCACKCALIGAVH